MTALEAGDPYGEDVGPDALIPDDVGRDPFVPRPMDMPTPVPLDPEADLAVLDHAKVFAGPTSVEDRPRWRDALHRWRGQARSRVDYDTQAYATADTAWVSRAWDVALVWLWDEALYDWENHRFDADRLISTYASFGGLDAVVLWHAYPVIGVDERNQFDWYRQAPGLRNLVVDLQERGVRVFLNYNPWDVGTRRSPRSDGEELAELLTDLGADGLFLDTMKRGEPAIVAQLAALRPHLVLEGESSIPLSAIAEHHASWAQWMVDSEVPGVLRARWFEQRHQMHHTRRWDRDRGPQLSSAWVNGAGVLIWDVVFGAAVPWSEEDKATARAVRRVRTTLGDHLVDGVWEPLTDLHPDATAAGIGGSRWDLDGSTLLTLVARGDYSGPLLAKPHTGRVLEVLTGQVLEASGTLTAGPDALLGLLLVPEDPTGGALPEAVVGLMAGAQADVGRGARRGGGANLTPTRGPTTRRATIPAHGCASPGAVIVSGGHFDLGYLFRKRETGLYERAPYVGDWKPLFPRLHDTHTATRSVTLGHGGDVAVDAAPVTNMQFAAFLAATGYRPPVAERFLPHWADGLPDPRDTPVTYVDIEDARAYAAWRGARLPSEDEWQVAAGAAGWVVGPPLREWTESEHRDGRTRWVVVKGGTAKAVRGSAWYLDGGDLPPQFSVRLLLTGGGTARSAQIGFRCAVDIPARSPATGTRS